MEITKKITSFAAVLAIVGSLATLPASAKNVNDCSITYTTLTEAVTTTTGESIPAGSVAVTMSIQNNSGFTDNMFLFNLEHGCNVICDNDNKPIIESQSVLDNFLVAGSVTGDKLCVAVASAEEAREDGELLTFYCTTAFNVSSNPVSIGVMNNAVLNIGGSVYSPLVNQHYVQFGDVNGDGLINSSDASITMIAIANNNDDPINVNALYYSPQDITQYYPPACYNANADCYLCSDVLISDPDAPIRFVDNDDAYEILSYAAWYGSLPANSTEVYSGDGCFDYVYFNFDLL